MSSHNLLVLSDVHLGSELVQHARPEAPSQSETSRRRDRELVALLDWYRTHRDEGRAWRLVIAGDLVDFSGMCVSPNDEELVTEPNAEEKLHGLGNAVDHTLGKLRRVAAHHEDVFKALARFVDAGNNVVVVRGNHDVDFHWAEVQQEFTRLIAKQSTQQLASRPGNIEFADWFYYEEGVAYIEHGHQYDDLCSYEHVLHPVLPSDPRRSHRSLSDVLLRYVVRPTRGMTEGGHEERSAIDYVRFGMRLGVTGMLALGRRFAVAIATLVTLWRESFSDAAHWVRKEHERKMSMLSEAKQISIVRLRALASLQRPPVTKSLLKLLAGVMVDRVMFGVLTFLLLVTLVITRWTPELGIYLVCSFGLLLPATWLWRRVRSSIDASALLRESAPKVAALFPAAFVVMGHTHQPEWRPVRQRHATYVNLGAWAEEEADADDHPLLPATRTHLVIRVAEDGPQGELRQWVADVGPTRYHAPGDTSAAAAAEDSTSEAAPIAVPILERG